MKRVRKKIAIVCEFFPPHLGGGETLLYLHGLQLTKSGKFSIRVITARQGLAPSHEKINPHFEVFRYSWSVLFGHPVAKLGDISLHAKWADIFHTVTYSCAIQSLLVSKKYHKPIVLSFFEVLGRQWLSVASSPFEGFAFFIYESLLTKLPFDVFHAISKHTYSKLIPKLSKKSSVMIYPFIARQHPPKQSVTHKDYFLFFGRAGKTKGLPVLVQAIILLHERGISPQFVLIIGEYPAADRQKIMLLLKQHKLEKVVILEHQPKERLTSYIKYAKAVIIPSVTEGFGYAAQEASALGAPVIYSSNTSLDEVVRLGRSFKVGDPNALADTIEHASSQSWKRNKISIDNDRSLGQWTQNYSNLTVHNRA